MRLLQWVAEAVPRDWKRPNDPMYYAIYGIVFLFGAGVFLSGGHVVWVIVTLTFAAFSIYIVVDALRRRSRGPDDP